MKKLVIISPQYNGLKRYSEPLCDLIKKKLEGKWKILYIGSSNINFNIEEIKKEIDELTNKIIDFNPDLIHYNYGTYDCDQLIPYFLENKGFKCKSILTYHSLQLDLFKKIENEFYDKICNTYLRKMDGYCFFTNYARKIFEEKFGTPSIYTISFHPATHEIQTLNEKEKSEFDKKFSINRSKKIATLLGYPSHWKETGTLIKLCKNFPNVTFVVGGPWWKEKILKENDNINLDKLHNLIIINKELDYKEFEYCLNLGVGIFPYKYFKSFQGSGLIPNYLLKGIGCIANNIEPMKEYLNNEYCFDFTNENELFDKFNKIINEREININKNFCYDEHANNIIKFYTKVIK